MTIILDNSDLGYVGKGLIDSEKSDELTLDHFDNRIKPAVALADQVCYKAYTKYGKQIIKLFKKHGKLL